APPHSIAEIGDVALSVQPRPAGPPGVAASGLGIDLGGPFQRGRGGPGGWIFHDEPELHFGSDVLVPDLAAWRVERAPSIRRPSLRSPPSGRARRCRRARRRGTGSSRRTTTPARAGAGSAS